MANPPDSSNDVSASSSEDLKEAPIPESYPIFLSVIKSERLTDRLDKETKKRKSKEQRLRNREYVIEKWMETLEGTSPSDPPVHDVAEESIEEPFGNRDYLLDQWTLGDTSSCDPPATEEGAAERRRRSDGSEKRKRKSDVKKESIVIKTETPDDDKENSIENKPPVESSPGAAAIGGRYYQAFKKATEFLKDVKRELFFTNPDAYQQFLDIFEESKHNREDLTDRLRVVAEAKDVIGHREDLMQRLVDMAMSDLPVQKSLQPLRPLVTAPPSSDNRGAKRRSRGCEVEVE